MRAGVLVSSVVFVVCAACSKKPAKPTSFTTSCVLSDADGTTAQCFERTDDQPRIARKSHCDEYEAAKKELRDGPCPSQGRLGTCDTHDGHKSACYRDRADCEERCSKSGGTFSPG